MNQRPIENSEEIEVEQCESSPTMIKDEADG